MEAPCVREWRARAAGSRPGGAAGCTWSRLSPASPSRNAASAHARRACSPESSAGSYGRSKYQVTPVPSAQPLWASWPQTYLVNVRVEVHRPGAPREAARDLHVLDLPDPIGLQGPPRPVVELAGREEGVAAHGPAALSAVRVLPQPGGAHVQPAVHRVAQVHEHVAAVDRDVVDRLLDEGVRVTGLDRRRGKQLHETQARGDADPRFRKLLAHDGFSAVGVRVARLADADDGRHGPGLAAEAIAGREREVPERGVPAEARVVGQAGERRRPEGPGTSRRCKASRCWPRSDR